MLLQDSIFIEAEHPFRERAGAREKRSVRHLKEKMFRGELLDPGSKLLSFSLEGSDHSNSINQRVGRRHN